MLKLMDNFFTKIINQHKYELLELDTKYIHKDYKNFYLDLISNYTEFGKLNKNELIKKNTYYSGMLNKFESNISLISSVAIKSMIIEKWQNDRINKYFTEINKSVNIDNKKSLIEKLNEELFDIAETKIIDIKQGIEDKFNDLKNPSVAVNNLLFTNRFKILDNKLRGYGGLIFIGGRPGMNKSTFINNLVFEFISNNFKGLYFSFDDNKNNFFSNAMAYYTGIENRVIASNLVQDNLFEMITQKIERVKNNLFLSFDYSNIIKIKFLIEQYIKLKKINFVVIDYLQIIKYNQSRPVDEITKITQLLRELSHKYDITIFILSQIKRENVKDNEHLTHSMADLKGSGSIEADATAIIFLEGVREANERHIYIAKQKMGYIGRPCKYLLDKESHKMTEAYL